MKYKSILENVIENFKTFEGSCLAYIAENCGVREVNRLLFQYVQLDSFLLIYASKSGNGIARNLFERTK